MKNAFFLAELEKWTLDNKTILLEVTKVDNSRLLPRTLYLSALCINSIFKCLLSKTLGLFLLDY